MAKFEYYQESRRFEIWIESIDINFIIDFL